MKPPSTEWREQVAPDEEDRFRRYGEQFVEFQKRRNARYGMGRALHRKQVLALRATLTVLPDITEPAQHGLFAAPGVRDAWIRLSNATMNIRRDSAPDVRGFGLKVFGVSGPGALGGTATSQNFALVSVPGFSSPNAAQFAGLIVALSHGQRAAFRHLVRTYGPLRGIRIASSGRRILRSRFTGFATSRFYSAAAIRVGPYAARIRLLPHRSDVERDASADLAADMRRHLETGPVAYDLQLQFFTDEKRTPIENASTVWSERESPFHTVATLTVAPQALDGPDADAFAGTVESSAFDPWNALEEHRPLGDIMRARKVVYYASEHERGAA